MLRDVQQLLRQVKECWNQTGDRFRMSNSDRMPGGTSSFDS